MDNEISIGIKATGGDQAASEVKKADAALEQLGKQAVQTDAALDSLAASGGASTSASGRRGGRSGRGAAAAMKEITEEAPKATAATRGVGAAAQQVGYQVGDFAVQVGGGTSALTALAQQGSQLLGIFGPYGALAGALLAVGAASYSAFSRGEEAAEENSEAVDALNKRMAEFREQLAGWATEADSAAFERFAESLDAEAAALKLLNEELDRNISLMQARRRAQAEIESAQAALELAKIDADPSLSEEEKIRRRAGVQEGIEQGKLRDRLAGIGDRVAGANDDAQIAAREAEAASEARKAVQRDLSQRMLERQELAPRVNARDRLEEERRLYEEAVAKARAMGEESGSAKDGILRSPEEKEAVRRANQALARLKQTEKDAATDDEVARFEALDPGIEARSEELERKNKEEIAAREEAEKAARRRDQVAAEAVEETKGAVNAFELERQRRGVSTDAQVRERQDRERERQEKEEERRREQERREREGVGRSGEGLADRAARAVAGTNERAARGFEDLGNRIAADPTAGGLEELARGIGQAAAGIESRDARNARALRVLQQEVERLKAAVRKGGDGK